MSETSTTNHSAGANLDSYSFHIIGIGASAGGLEALSKLFTIMPLDLPCAFVVVTHLDPTHKSLMPEILSRCTSLSVSEITDGLTIEPRHIYVIPPNRELAINNGRFRVSSHIQPRGFRTPINGFFSCLARECGVNTIAVIMSGTGSDGAMGIREINEAGGRTVVQEPAEAKYDGMPLAAIQTGVVDEVLPIAKMPAYFESAVKDFHGYSNGTTIQSKHESEPHDEESYLRIIDLLRSRTDHDFSNYKPPTILRRMNRRVIANDLDSLKSYVSFIESNQEEVTVLFNELLINVTRFFRDDFAFKYLSEVVIPELVANFDTERQIRIWVAGCSTGEEAYSIAMLIHDEITKQKRHLDAIVFATDIDSEALSVARVGLYNAESVESIVPEKYIHRYFSKVDNKYKISRLIRDMVVFSKHDLILNPPLSRLDMISCRNVFIYFSPELQAKILAAFHYSLFANGILFLGPSESLPGTNSGFVSIDSRSKLFRRTALPSVNFRSESYFLPRFPIVSSSRQPTNKSRDSFGKEIAFKYLLQNEVPSGAVIDSDFNVVMLVGNFSEVFSLPIGEFNQSLFAIASQALALELKATVFSCAKSRKPTSYQQAKLNTVNGTKIFDINATPIFIDGSDTGLTFIKFVYRGSFESSDSIDQPPLHDAQNMSTRYVEVSNELSNTRALLATVIEDAEFSYQQLTASNEELMSTNEELQSTGQELETSREELQSLNEELETVNSELRRKIEDLSDAYSDINNLLNSAEIGTIFLDENLNIKNYTTDAAKILSLIESDVGRPISALAARLVNVDLFHLLQTVVTGAAIHEGEVRSVDGRWFVMKIVPYRTIENRVQGVVMTFVDITSLRRTEESLEKTESTLSAMFSATPDALLSINSEGTVDHFSTGNLDFIFDAPSKLHDLNVMMKPSPRVLQPQDANANLLRIVRTIEKRQQVVEFEFSVQDSDDLKKTIECRVAYSRNGQIFCLFRDITARREAENLRIAKDSAEKISQSKSDFLANMSHELRTPLNGIMGFAEILLLQLHGELNAKQRHHVDAIYTSGKHLLDLVNEVLDLAKIEAGSLTLNKEIVKLEDVIANAIKSVEPLLKDADLTCEFKNSLGSFQIPADRLRILQIVNNLIGNAIKFTPKGGRIEVASKLHSDKTIEISVADSGPGIPEELHEKIFDRFEQVKDEAHAAKKGTGLGLAMVKSLVELHNGSVHIECPGIAKLGSKFIVRLPF